MIRYLMLALLAFGSLQLQAEGKEAPTATNGTTGQRLIVLDKILLIENSAPFKAEAMLQQALALRLAENKMVPAEQQYLLIVDQKTYDAAKVGGFYTLSPAEKKRIRPYRSKTANITLSVPLR